MTWFVDTWILISGVSAEYRPLAAEASAGALRRCAPMDEG
jgi:hypothetical protein